MLFVVLIILSTTQLDVQIINIENHWLKGYSDKV